MGWSGCVRVGWLCRSGVVVGGWSGCGGWNGWGGGGGVEQGGMEERIRKV